MRVSTRLHIPYSNTVIEQIAIIAPPLYWSKWPLFLKSNVPLIEILLLAILSNSSLVSKRFFPDFSSINVSSPPKSIQIAWRLAITPFTFKYCRLFEFWFIYTFYFYFFRIKSLWIPQDIAYTCFDWLVGFTSSFINGRNFIRISCTSY
jgi:hypothetical protein